MDIYISSYKNDLERVKELIEQGVDVNVTKTSSDTPLHHAVYNNNLEMVKLLVEKGKADVNTLISKNKNSTFYLSSGKKNFYEKKINFINTPLHHACLYKKWDIVNYLISKGSNGNILNEKQHTANYYMK